MCASHLRDVIISPKIKGADLMASVADMFDLTRENQNINLKPTKMIFLFV